MHVQQGDSELWISVYEELLAGNRRILEEMRNHGSSPAIELHIRRLEVGLAFWTRQRRPDPEPVPERKLLNLLRH